jgi:hypothetical protein
MEKSLKVLVESTIKKNPFGFTLDLRTGKTINYGFIVAYAETQNSFNHEGLINCISHAFAHDWVIGMWINDQGIQQFDSCKVLRSKSKAIDFGLKQNQIAIWDVNEGTEIRLK